MGTGEILLFFSTLDLNRQDTLVFGFYVKKKVAEEKLFQKLNIWNWRHCYYIFVK